MESAADKTPPFRDIVHHGSTADSRSASPAIAFQGSAADDERHAAGTSMNGQAATADAPAQHDANQQRQHLSLWGRFQLAAERLKRQVVVLYYASQDPHVGWPSKAIASVALMYAASPLDLIPDCIPVLGLLDDLIIVPGLIWLAVHLMPDSVLERARERAQREPVRLHDNLAAAAIILLIWGGGAFAGVWWACRKWGRGWVQRHPLPPAAAAAGVLLLAGASWLAYKVRSSRNTSSSGSDVEEAQQPLLTGAGDSEGNVDGSVTHT